MKKIVLVPDSFKGTLSSIQLCGIMTEEIKKRLPDCEIVSIPVADGGEGSVDCFLTALGGEKITVTVSGPFMEDMEACYGILPGGKTAVIEMAACVGLPLAEGRLNPEITTTFGIGQMMLDAVKRGCTELIIGLGGSCTNDAGCGAAAAAGALFFDEDGRNFVPVGGTLEKVAKIDISALRRNLAGIQITAMCDIDNLLYGTNGAAYVFAPQKGADASMVRRLDDGLRLLSGCISKDLGVAAAQVPGSGAAGGFGCGMLAFFGAQLKMGIETVLDTVHFDRTLADADLVFTGEGKLDSQSLRGKVVIGVARRAKAGGVPCIAIVGQAEEDSGDIYTSGVTAVFTTNRRAETFEVLRPKAAEYFRATFVNILNTLLIQK